MDKDHWLNRVLADVESQRGLTDLDPSMYGAADIVAKYCGFSEPPSPLPGHWQHGWKAPHRRLTAEYEMGELEPLQPEEYYWVARQDQEECLRQAGLKNARAIGLPCVYLPRRQPKRHENSLLVMPAHSLDYTRHDWKFEEYADQIESIRQDFDEVIACVHQSCFERGLWVDAFRQRNIPVVVGAHTSDPLTLYRQQAMLSSFGWVTTNSHGSHLAYGAFWGARVSIFGSYANLREEDFCNTPFYQRYPELIRPAVTAINEPAMREHYPWLFVDHPRDASARVDWGTKELGADNRLSPTELKRAFDWNWQSRFAAGFSALTTKIVKAIVPKPIRRKFDKRRSEESQKQKAFDKEIFRIQASTNNQLNSSSLLGHELTFRDGNSCAADIRLFFEQEVLRFHSTHPQPRIIDWGAKIGLATIYLAQLHPTATILAAESEPEDYELLDLNCRAFGLTDVKLIQSTRRESEPGLPSEAGASCASLNELLGHRVDLLKLDLTQSDQVWFEFSQNEFPNVERIYIQFDGDFQQDIRLSGILGVLERSGFRVHLHAPQPASEPFVHRPVSGGCDLRLRIFAFRESNSR